MKIRNTKTNRIKWLVAISFLPLIALATQRNVYITYSNIHSLNASLSDKQCRELLVDDHYHMDHEKMINFPMGKKHQVKGSYTAIRDKIGNIDILVKRGLSTITIDPKTTITTTRLALVKISPDGNSSGKIVLETYCSADFVGKRE